MTTTTALPVGTWKLDSSATKVTVSVKKFGFYPVPATLKVTSGTIEIDDKNQVVNVEIIADASSYTSKSAKRNEHVIGSDFLDANNHPQIVFKAASVAAVSGGYNASGTVTIKGKVSPIEVVITDLDVAESSGSFTATATVDRKSVGVDSAPTFVVGRTLELSVVAKATRST